MVSVVAKVPIATRNRTLINHFKEMISVRDSHVDCILADRDTFEFIFRIRNLKGMNDELEEGEYLLKLVPPYNYPLKPPSFIFLTPNGIYDLGGPICISTGEYHSQNYRATGKMIGFARDAWTAMVQWKDLGGGIRIIKNRNEKTIRKHAQDSKDYNLAHYAHYIELLNKLPMNRLYNFMDEHPIHNQTLKKSVYACLGIH